MTTLTVMPPSSNGDGSRGFADDSGSDCGAQRLPHSSSHLSPDAVVPDRPQASPNSDSSSINSKDSQSPSLSSGKTPRRVKVYLLDGENWIDNGTGYCKGEIEVGTNRPYFVVRNELDSDNVILKSFLEGNIQYQRQQETLIVWTDPSGKDLALSFQETEGCADLCEFIIKVQQQNYSPEISLYYVISSNHINDSDNYAQMGAGADVTELITGPIKYPSLPTVSNIEEILEVVNPGSSSNYSRTCIANFVVEKDYLTKLIEVFNKSEEEKLILNLYALSEIVKTFVLYNESSLIEDFVSTKSKVLGVVGILEYDAEFPNFKACHRDYLRDRSHFKTVIDVPSDEAEETLSIFEKDFYLNFLKDVVLARFLDDQSFNMFSTLIHLNQIAIIDFIKDSSTNGHFLEKLFKFYQEGNDAVELEKKRDGIRMLHQHVLITKSIQPFQRTDFFAVLIKSGLFSMIKFALQDSDLSIRTAGTELIVSIIEQDVSLVNSIDNDEAIDISEPPPRLPVETVSEDSDTSYTKGDLRLKLSDDMTLISLLAHSLLEVNNHGLKTQAFEALKILLDSNIGLGCMDENEPKWVKNNASNDISTKDYFQAFYTGVAPKLFSDLIALAQQDKPAESLVKKILQDQLLYQQLCELFTFCSMAHNKSLQRTFFIRNNILLGVGKLLGLDCKMTLKLSAIRCLSNVLACNDKFYYRYMLEKKVIDIFFKFFETVVEENNLASSSCLSLLEVLTNIPPVGRNRHNFKVLLQYINDNYREFCLNKLAYVSTGSDLLELYEKLVPKSERESFKLAASGGPGNLEDDESEDDEDHSEPNIANASTPINGDVLHEEPPRIHNLFEDIEKDLSQTNKRIRGSQALAESQESKKLK